MLQLLTMKDVRITVIRKAEYRDLIEKYEGQINSPCCVEEGDVFISKDANFPEGFCQSAWHDLYPFVFALSSGATSIYDNWMKNPHSAMISCNDGFRPVSFLLEVVE